jgi:hypothetical protein
MHSHFGSAFNVCGSALETHADPDTGIPVVLPKFQCGMRKILVRKWSKDLNSLRVEGGWGYETSQRVLLAFPIRLKHPVIINLSIVKMIYFLYRSFVPNPYFFRKLTSIFIQSRHNLFCFRSWMEKNALDIVRIFLNSTIKWGFDDDYNDSGFFTGISIIAFLLTIKT